MSSRVDESRQPLHFGCSIRTHYIRIEYTQAHSEIKRAMCVRQSTEEQKDK